MTEDHVLQLLKDMNVDKAAGIDNLSGKFLKDGANILAKPISELCNLSIKYCFSKRLPDCQIKTTIQKGFYNTSHKLSSNFITSFDI